MINGNQPTNLSLRCRLAWKVQVAVEIHGETVELASDSAVVKLAGGTVLSPPQPGTKVELKVLLPANQELGPKSLICKGVVERILELEGGERLVRCKLHKTNFTESAETKSRNGRKQKAAWTM